MPDTSITAPHAPGGERRPRAGAQPQPDVEIVVPVYNEQRVLGASVHTLHARLVRDFDFSFRITVADNASTDCTPEVARALARELPRVRALHLERKGRGHALRRAWGASEAAVLAYMDVDLSTDLSALGELLLPLLDGRGDIAIGSRLHPAPRSSAACGASSSRAPTTCCCAARSASASPTRSAASRPAAAR